MTARRHDGAGPARGEWLPPAQLGPVYLAVFLFASGEQALHVLISPYMTVDLGMTPSAIGSVVAVFGLASLLTRWPIGALYRLHRARRLLLLGGLLCSSAFALVPVFPTPTGFAALMAMDGVGWSIQTTTLLAVLVVARPSGMSTASAMGWYAGFTGLGNATAGWYAGAMADALGFHASFLALAAIPAAATVVLVVAMPPFSMPTGHGQDDGASRGGGRPRTEPRAAALRSMPALVWASVVVMFYINFANNVLIAFHPVLVIGAGITITQIGILSSLRSLASSTSRLLSGPLFARVEPERLTTSLLLLSAVPLVLLPTFAGSFWWQVPLFLATGVGRGLLRVTGSALAMDAVEHDERLTGPTSALLHAGLDSGKIAGPFLGGLMAQAVGVATMFRVLPCVLLVAYAALRLRQRQARAGARKNG